MPLDNLINNGTKCCWCDDVDIPTQRHKYCEPLCGDSAYMFCYPQGPANKAYVLKNQGWACTICGLSYEEEAHAQLRRIAEEDGLVDGPLTGVFYRIGYKISQRMDMDHIKPICKGGVGIGNRNHQVICRPCHHKKTARQRETIDWKRLREKY